MRVETPPRRVVSMVPSLTELLFALGADDVLVGVTRYCTEPAARVAALPQIGGTKNPDVAGIVALRPDLVVMNAEENRREDFTALVAAGHTVYVTEPKTVDAGVQLIVRLGALVGRAEPAARLAEAQAAGVAAVRARVRERPTVPYFCPIWRKPWMAFDADTYAHDLLRVAGGRNVAAELPRARRAAREPPARYPRVTLEDIAASSPAIVLLPDEPYRFSARDLAALALLATTPALRRRRVYFVDGKALTWYGPRIADAVDTYARLFAETVD